MRKEGRTYKNHPGKPPKIICDLKDEEIFELGKKNINTLEDDVIISLGVKAKSIPSTKSNKRWRYHYERGRAEGRRNYNEKLTESKDATIQKEIAKSTLPPPEIIEEGYEFVIDAPEWFKKGIGGRKTGRPKNEET